MILFKKRTGTLTTMPSKLDPANNADLELSSAPLNSDFFDLNDQQDNDNENGRNGPRRSFLRKALTGLAVVPAFWAITSSKTAEAQGLPRPNFLPNLYRGQNRRNFNALKRHENEHVEFLLGALGNNARPKPVFQNLAQPNLLSLARVTQALENTGVGAYLAATPLIEDSGILAAAASVALIEARHAGWVNTLLNDPITLGGPDNMEQSFDTPLSVEEVINRASPFIANLNGPAPSVANDLDILNFALLLEFLEAEFYNVNGAIYGF